MSEVNSSSAKFDVAFSTHFLDLLSDEMWQQILRKLSIYKRIRLEVVCKRFAAVMPYDDIGILDYDEIERNFKTRSYQYSSAVHDFLDTLHRKSLRKTVKIMGFTVKLPANFIVGKLALIASYTVTVLRLMYGNLEVAALVLGGIFPNLAELELGIDGDLPLSLPNFATALPKLTKLTCRSWLPEKFPELLMHLTVRDTSRREFSFSDVVNCKMLQFLELSNSSVVKPNLTVQQFPVSHLNALVSLSLSSLAGDKIPLFLEHFSAIAGNLTTLSLNTVQFSSQISRLLPFRYLQNLSMVNVNGLRRFIAMCGAKNLRNLDIVNTGPQLYAIPDPGDDMDALLEVATRFPQLKRLDFRGIGGFGDGAQLGTIFKSCTALETVSVALSKMNSADLLNAVVAPAGLRLFRYKLHVHYNLRIKQVRCKEALNMLCGEIIVRDVRRHIPLCIEHDWETEAICETLKAALAERGFCLKFIKEF